MLASTVQFSNNNRNHSYPIPPTPNKPKGNSRLMRKQEWPEKETRNKGNLPAPPMPVLSGPNSVPTALHPSPARSNSPQQRNGPPQPQRINGGHVVLDTRDKQIPELVSVPPVSSTAERTSARGPEPFMDLCKQQARASCSLERR